MFTLVVTYCVYIQGRPSDHCKDMPIAHIRAASTQQCQVQRNASINGVIQFGRTQGWAVSKYECVKA